MNFFLHSLSISLMKVETVDGKVVETNELSDKKAEIYEAITNLYKACERYNVAMVARVVIDKDNTLGANYMYQGDEQTRWENVTSLIGQIDEYLSSSTGGAVRVAPVEPTE